MKKLIYIFALIVSFTLITCDNQDENIISEKQQTDIEQGSPVESRIPSKP
jgi:uncharacterized lipoprotein NlpE involved in copper resistance